MPYQKYTSHKNFRILISGLSNSGKTTSLPTFLYGPFDYEDENEREQAIEYSEGKTLHIIVCPDETGVRSLPLSSPQISSYVYESPEGIDPSSCEWSEKAISSFNSLFSQLTKEQPDILVLDGLHSLWRHLMNKVTQGEYLQGLDLNLNPRTGNIDPYRSAKFYSTTHITFGQYLAALYTSSIPLIICTTWEQWESGLSEGDKPGSIASTRYLWPDIPGEMAKRLVGRFDARVSCRVNKRCLHASCEDNKKRKEHYTWQFYPLGDVQGVGIKGLKVNERMKETPWIHQNWHVLKGLIEGYT